MSGSEVPAVSWAVIGGSATRGCSFPDDAGAGAEVIETGLSFETPYGPSPEMKLFVTAGGRRCLAVELHGWQPQLPRGEASRRLFWVFSRAGVRHIVADAGVGSLNPLLDPRDIVIADDFVDLTTDRDPRPVVGGNLMVMRDPVCPVLASALTAAARRHARGRVFDRGTCVVTEGPRFESRAEIRMMQAHGDIIGQSMCPEVWLARDIGACYAALYVVVNYAEGVVRDWDHDLLAEIFTADAARHARIVLEAIDATGEDAPCQCLELRKPTLL